MIQGAMKAYKMFSGGESSGSSGGGGGFLDNISMTDLFFGEHTTRLSLF